MHEGRSALTANDFGVEPLATWIGRVRGVESSPLPRPLGAWECRNDRLAWLGLHADGFIDAVHAARERHGAARVAVVVGTSTSSIGATEEAYRALDADGRFPVGNRNPLVHTPHSLGLFVREALALEGPCVIVSTACSSSAKVCATVEPSDANRMPTPPPADVGAERALDDALARAGVDAAAVDHINLHGTASAKNDEVEAKLIARRFPAATHASSTKGITGHTLGAAG